MQIVMTSPRKIVKIGGEVNGEAKISLIAINERKMLRLAFHDCLLYEDGTGGCDGCLNLNSDENLDDNDGLQFTVAVLEKLYTDKDFPSNRQLPHEPKLTLSPKDLGISKFILWASSTL